jgi:hypothetical protein
LLCTQDDTIASIGKAEVPNTSQGIEKCAGPFVSLGFYASIDKYTSRYTPHRSVLDWNIFKESTEFLAFPLSQILSWRMLLNYDPGAFSLSFSY